LLLVLANMSIVALTQVSFARRCVDGLIAHALELQQRDASKAAAQAYEVPAEGDDLAPPPMVPLAREDSGNGRLRVPQRAPRSPHIVFLLHKSQDQMRLSPVYHTTSCDWTAVYVDDWGLEARTNGDDDDGDESIDPTPWLRMLFGIKDETTAAAAQAAFRERVEGKLDLALQKCKFPRDRMRQSETLPQLKHAAQAYSRGSPVTASQFVRHKLVERPYIYDALVTAFGLVWSDEVGNPNDSNLYASSARCLLSIFELI
jgi:hypothetical protein